MEPSFEGSARPDQGSSPSGSGEPMTDVLRDGVVEQMEAQKDRTADQADRAAEALRDAAGSLQGQEAWIGGLVERGADELARLAQTLRTNNLQSLLGYAEDFARRQPVLFAGAGFALGFVLTRATQTGLAAMPGGVMAGGAETGRAETGRAETVAPSNSRVGSAAASHFPDRDRTSGTSGASDTTGDARHEH